MYSISDTACEIISPLGEVVGYARQSDLRESAKLSPFYIRDESIPVGLILTLQSVYKVVFNLVVE
jgi:hypothetical protein